MLNLTWCNSVYGIKVAFSFDVLGQTVCFCVSDTATRDISLLGTGAVDQVIIFERNNSKVLASSMGFLVNILPGPQSGSGLGLEVVLSMSNMMYKLRPRYL